MFRKLNALFVLAIVLSISGAAQQPGRQGKTWAVVVGISRYQKLPGGLQLQFAERDATLFAESIQKRGVGTYNLRLLTGPEATVSAIKSAIGTWLARSVSPADTVIFFFSGHGLFEKEFGESYLLGFDSDAKDPFGTALGLNELKQALAVRLRAAHVVVIADAVRRDFFDPETDPGSAKSFAQGFEQLTAARQGLSAILASSPGEFSREGQRWGGHGVFAKHLADVLAEGSDRNGDGTQTAEELFDALAPRVSTDTSNKQHIWKSGIGLDQVALGRFEGPTPTSASAPPPKPPAGDSDRQIAARTREETRSVRAEPKPQPPPVSAGDKTAPASPPVVKNDTEPVAPPERSSSAKPGGRVPAPSSAPAAETARVVPPDIPAVPKASTTRSPRPPATETVRGKQEAIGPVVDTRPPSNIPVRSIPPPPEPTIRPPAAVAVSRDSSTGQPATLATSVPASRPEAAPSPLVLQLEAAIGSRRLIEPRNSSAWDFYQRLASEPGGSFDAARLKPKLAAALVAEGRAIAGGDVRGDNVSDKVDAFKRAGQLLARARSLEPDNQDVVALEKLSAAEALISLQFYDEAERSLSPLQNAKLAAVENAMGLVYHGKLDTFRAERAFKRAIEIDPKWAAPHYNLALLYRSQQNQASLAELEAAALLDPTNVELVAALGEEFFTRQQFKQAADAFRQAVLLKPSDDTLHTKLGHALYSQGLQEEANREYQKARELRGKQP